MMTYEKSIEIIAKYDLPSDIKSVIKRLKTTLLLTEMKDYTIGITIEIEGYFDVMVTYADFTILCTLAEKGEVAENWKKMLTCNQESVDDYERIINEIMEGQE